MKRIFLSFIGFIALFTQGAHGMKIVHRRAKHTSKAFVLTTNNFCQTTTQRISVICPDNTVARIPINDIRLLQRLATMPVVNGTIILDASLSQTDHYVVLNQEILERIVHFIKINNQNYYKSNHPLLATFTKNELKTMLHTMHFLQAPEHCIASIAHSIIEKNTINEYNLATRCLLVQYCSRSIEQYSKIEFPNSFAHAFRNETIDFAIRWHPNDSWGILNLGDLELSSLYGIELCACVIDRNAVKILYLKNNEIDHLKLVPAAELLNALKAVFPRLEKIIL